VSFKSAMLTVVCAVVSSVAAVAAELPGLSLLYKWAESSEAGGGLVTRALGRLGLDPRLDFRSDLRPDEDRCCGLPSRRRGDPCRGGGEGGEDRVGGSLWDL